MHVAVILDAGVLEGVTYLGTDAVDDELCGRSNIQANWIRPVAQGQVLIHCHVDSRA